MIHRVADTSQISYHCELLGKEFVYSITIVAGSKVLSTLQKPIPQDVDGIRDLVQGYWVVVQGYREGYRADPVAAAHGPMTEREVRRMYWNRRHYEEGAARQKAVEELIRQQSVLSNKCFAALQAATKAIEKQMEFVVPIKTPFIFDCEGRHYSHHENCLWSSTRRLTVEQWLGLISQVVNRESAKLASLSGRNAAPLDRRTAISTSVRTEVWRRDEGRCVRCGSRDRLEFDHIIPVALGGSNTSRNIELLCETCNRLKSASIG